eukprot:g11707.t1
MSVSRGRGTTTIIMLTTMDVTAACTNFLLETSGRRFGKLSTTSRFKPATHTSCLSTRHPGVVRHGRVPSILSRMKRGGSVVCWPSSSFSERARRFFFKLMLFPMKDYVFLINQLQVLFFIPLFYLFSWMHRSGKDGEESEPPTAATPSHGEDSAADIASADHTASRQIIFVAVLEFCNMFLQLLSGSHLPGAVQVLLAQVRIPVTMALSAALLHTKYVARQYFGVALTFAGIVIAVLPSLFETTDLNENEPAGETVRPVLWSLVLMVAAIPSCLANVTRERILKGVSPIGKDPYALALRISVCQFVLGLPLLVVLAPLNGLSLSELPSNFYQGCRCWLIGQSTPPVAPPGVDKCAVAPYSTWSFLLCNFAYNLIQMVVFRYASASIQIVATTMIIPLSAIAFTLPAVMGSYAQPLHSTDVVATVLIAIGVVIYKSVIRFNTQYLKYSFGMTTAEIRVPLTSIVKHHSKEEEMILSSLGDLVYKFGLAKKYANKWKKKASKSDLNDDHSPLLPDDHSPLLSDDHSPLLPEYAQSNSSSGLSLPFHRDVASTSSTHSQQHQVRTLSQANSTFKVMLTAVVNCMYNMVSVYSDLVQLQVSHYRSLFRIMDLQ